MTLPVIKDLNAVKRSVLQTILDMDFVVHQMLSLVDGRKIEFLLSSIYDTGDLFDVRLKLYAEGENNNSHRIQIRRQFCGNFPYIYVTTFRVLGDFEAPIRGAFREFLKNEICENLYNEKGLTKLFVYWGILKRLYGDKNRGDI